MSLLSPGHLKLRLSYLLLVSIIIPIGLATRKIPELFPTLIAEFGGDTLWATLFFLLFRMVFPEWTRLKTAILTYLFGVLIELSQLYQAQWIIEWRHTFLGQMLLGQGFLWSDLICYAVGVFFGWLLAFLFEEALLIGRSSLE
jgi:hypothetical protein